MSDHEKSILGIPKASVETEQQEANQRSPQVPRLACSEAEKRQASLNAPFLSTLKQLFP